MSEVTLSSAVNLKLEYRWDSEYYRKEYLSAEKLIHKLQTQKLREKCLYIKKGIFDLPPSNYQTVGVPLIRTSEIKNPLVNFGTTVFLSEETNAEHHKTALRPHDLVFTKIGAYIGDVAMLPNSYPYYNFSQNVAGAHLKDESEGAYILSFFLSWLGKSQILRSAMISGQGKLELEDIRNYEIPVVSNILKEGIQKLFSQQEFLTEKSKQTYAQAEEILLAEAGLKGFAPSSDPVNIKTFAESFATSGRLDAEYYQRKYEQVIAKLKAQPHNALTNLVTITKSIEPGSAHYTEEGLPFLRVADYTKYGTTEPQKYLSTDFVKANEKLIEKLKPKKGTVLFSKDGSVGIAYHLRENMNCITSGAILHLRVKNEKQLIPEYLTLALNSKLVQMQAERDAGGSIILHWRVSEIENVIVPIIDYTKQQEIAALVEESFALKKQSEVLLETAKRAVEIAVEEDEVAALHYLKSNS